mgnify:FL=1|jgi:hypothetical protein
MHRKIAHYLLILFFITVTTQSSAMPCYMVGVELTVDVQMSSSNNDCHDNISENDNNQINCQICKICSSSTVSIIEIIKFSHIENLKNDNYIVPNYHPISREIPTPPPNYSSF